MRTSLPSSLLFIVLLTACGTVRPDAQLGPVIDASRNVSVSSIASRTVFIRHFYYFARPTSWTILSSGDGRPVTLFEQTAVYALRPLATQNAVTRLGIIPGVRTDGIRPPGVHLTFGFTNLPQIKRIAQHSSAIVYLEDGPIYGGLNVVGDLDPRTSGDQPLRLLVDDRVRVATLAADGKTIAYVDDSGGLFIAQADGGKRMLLADVRANFGSVTISALQWEGHVEEGELRLDRVLMRLDRGFGDEIWAIGRVEPLTHVPSVPVEMIPKSDTAEQLEALNRMTQGIQMEDWRVPDPRSFSP